MGETFAISSGDPKRVLFSEGHSFLSGQRKLECASTQLLVFITELF